MNNFVVNFLKGLGIGTANVIPGVSGGTIALLTGIFERLINALKTFNIKALKLLFRGRFKDFAQHRLLLSRLRRYRRLRCDTNDSTHFRLFVRQLPRLSVVVFLRSHPRLYLLRRHHRREMELEDCYRLRHRHRHCLIYRVRHACAAEQ